MKIIGKGFIAKNFKKIKFSKRYIIYAAGVSNSNLKDKNKYKLEVKKFENFIRRVNKKKIIIYISTLSVEDKKLKNDLYVKNKLIIEKLAKKLLKRYIIIRLPQVIGHNKNKYTLTNWVFNSILKEKTLLIWKGSKRNIIDIYDVTKIIESFLKTNPRKNTQINILNPKTIRIENIIKIFENILNIKAKIKILSRKNKNINLKQISKKTFLAKKYYKNLDNKNYYKNIIKKYYGENIF